MSLRKKTVCSLHVVVLSRLLFSSTDNRQLKVKKLTRCKRHPGCVNLLNQHLVCDNCTTTRVRVEERTRKILHLFGLFFCVAAVVLAARPIWFRFIGRLHLFTVCVCECVLRVFLGAAHKAHHFHSHSNTRVWRVAQKRTTKIRDRETYF